jgi:hypothetical protein
MKFNLTRTAGLAAAVAVLAGGGLATAAVASTGNAAAKTVAQAQAAVPALTPAQVKYVHQSWGDPKTELGVVILAPKGWNMVKLSTFEAKFTSSNKLWNLRVNGVYQGATPVAKVVAQKKAALQGVKGYKLISQTNGSMKATNPSFEGVVFHYTTLVYSYTDGNTTRLVVDRFTNAFGANTTDLELSAGGRPQDRSGLEAVVNTATRDYVRLP